LEAEYVGLYKGGREAVWICWLLTSLNIPPAGAIILKCDNQAAIRISKNTVFADRNKHFEIHLHWIREKVLEGKVSPEYVSTHSNLADFLTKSLSRIKHFNCIEGVNLLGWKSGGMLSLQFGGYFSSRCAQLRATRMRSTYLKT
jgi:hypothetical protein